MPRFGPLKHQELIRSLRRLGFHGPHSGTKHQYMARGNVTVRIPNPHRGDIDKSLLARILREGGIDKEEWEDV